MMIPMTIVVQKATVICR